MKRICLVFNKTKELLPERDEAIFRTHQLCLIKQIYNSPRTSYVICVATVHETSVQNTLFFSPDLAALLCSSIRKNTCDLSRNEERTRYPGCSCCEWLMLICKRIAALCVFTSCEMLLLVSSRENTLQLIIQAKCKQLYLHWRLSLHVTQLALNLCISPPFYLVLRVLSTVSMFTFLRSNVSTH